MVIGRIFIGMVRGIKAQVRSLAIRIVIVRIVIGMAVANQSDRKLQLASLSPAADCLSV